MKFQRNLVRNLALAVVVAAIVFVLGLSEPSGYAVWLGYLFPVLIAAWSAPPRYAYLVTAGCTVLIGLGFAIGKSGSNNQVGLVNRSLDALVLWVIAFLTTQRTRAQQEHERLLQEVAVLEERQRLARELHDAVSQNLFSASMIADILPRLWQQNREEAQRRLQELSRLTRGAHAEMRTLLFELRPAALAEASLPDLIRQLVTATAARSGLQVNAELDGELALPSETKIAFYRIAQEALNNVIKHSKASEVKLALNHAAQQDGAPECVELSVSDNGCGFEMRGISSEHMGLRIMRERAAAAGFALQVHSQLGKGTQIVVTWPDGHCP